MRHLLSLRRAARSGFELNEWRKLIEERGTRKDKPIKPQVLAWQLGKGLAPDAIVSADSGTIATWFARQILARRGKEDQFTSIRAETNGSRLMLLQMAVLGGL